VRPPALALNQTAAAGMFGENLIFLPVRALRRNKKDKKNLAHHA